MGGSIRQETGWIQLGDVAIAFLFAVPLIQGESESEQVAAHLPAHAPA